MSSEQRVKTVEGSRYSTVHLGITIGNPAVGDAFELVEIARLGAQLVEARLVVPQQVGRLALLGDAAIVNDQDQIGIDDRAQAIYGVSAQGCSNDANARAMVRRVA